ncbi:MAG: hypothetical protein A2231_11455 [Candidatus Firestonebacteria bacterium RIFOXYA2_FULL_40_8]|nr:MAG: hypothetical protein A2231_11455 [Candidatus Firestonebacteria bacterium RIFOXYA2_FULL_40_8]
MGNEIICIHGNQSISDMKDLKRYIRKLLEVDNLCFLLGSGASCEAGGRNMSELGKEILPEIEKCFVKAKPFFEALKKMHVLSDGKTVDLERFISYLVNLQHVSTMEEKGFKTSFSKSRSKYNIKSVQIRSALNIYRKKVFELCSLPTEDKLDKLDVHKLFFKKVLAHRRVNQSRLAVFTSNYDLLPEKACDQLGITYLNGFHGVTERVFYPEVFDLDLHRVEVGERKRTHFYDKVVQLFKLHGSLTWIGADDSHNPFCIKELSFSEVARQMDSDEIAPIMIYPTCNKYGESTGFPYSEMLRRFGAFLTRTQTAIITIGYGFNDEHINSIIRQGLSQPSLTMVSFLPELKKEEGKFSLSNYPKEHFVNKLISAEDARIMFVGGEDAKWQRTITEVLPEVDEEDPLEQIRKTLDVTGRQ